VEPAALQPAGGVEPAQVAPGGYPVRDPTHVYRLSVSVLRACDRSSEFACGMQMSNFVKHVPTDIIPRRRISRGVQQHSGGLVRNELHRQTFRCLVR
jgi:hypothetical protein